MPRVRQKCNLTITGKTTRFPYGQLDGRRVYVVARADELNIENVIPVLIIDRTRGGSHNYLATRVRKPQA